MPAFKLPNLPEIRLNVFRRASRRSPALLFLVLVAVATLFYLQYHLNHSQIPDTLDVPNTTFDNLWIRTVGEFTYADNVTLIVPNIVHFIRLGDAPLSFVEVVCIRAAWLQQNPDALMIHCDQCKATANSPYWGLIKDIPVISLCHVNRPREIFGIKFSYVQHTSDIVRMLVLMKYGGIYLDGDAYLVRNLDAYRRYEMALGWAPGESIGTQVLVAHKDARFLRLWYDSYQEYRPDLWYWNAGELPTQKFLLKMPELVHRVPFDFGVQEKVAELLYMECNDSWRNVSALHLFFRHRKRLAYWDTVVHENITLENVASYGRNFGQMARLVLSGTTKIGVASVSNIEWLSSHELEYSHFGCSYPV